MLPFLWILLTAWISLADGFGIMASLSCNGKPLPTESLTVHVHQFHQHNGTGQSWMPVNEEDTSVSVAESDGDDAARLSIQFPDTTEMTDASEEFGYYVRVVLRNSDCQTTDTDESCTMGTWIRPSEANDLGDVDLMAHEDQFEEDTSGCPNLCTCAGEIIEKR